MISSASTVDNADERISDIGKAFMEHKRKEMAAMLCEGISDMTMSEAYDLIEDAEDRVVEEFNGELSDTSDWVLRFVTQKFVIDHIVKEVSDE